MKNNSNLFIAVIVIVGFIFFWDKLVVSRFTPLKPAVTHTNGSASLPPSNVGLPNAQKEVPSSRNQTAPHENLQLSSTEIHTESSDVIVDSLGGRISSWKIKEHDHWIELVSKKKDAKTYPLETFGDLNFGVDSTAANKIVLSAVHPDGFSVRKTIVLNSLSELGSVTIDFKNISKKSVSIDSSIGWGEGLDKHVIGDANAKKKAQAVDAHFAEMRAVAYAGKLMSWKPGMIFGREIDQTFLGPFEWVGVDNNHFIAAFTPTEEAISDVSVFANRKTAPTLNILIKATLVPGQSKLFTYGLYVGPKNQKSLTMVGHNLEKSISFGTFGFISKALLRALDFFKGATGNYGWAIIILTICLQIVVFPLTKKSLSHSLRMKELQPQLKQLQAQFKPDPKRLQIETLNLYKKNGMKFMGLEGCFPVLLQIPVFFAFYSALNGAYELRGAPWIFWIKDLAAPDSFYVLPILMGAGMYFQQKLTTVPTDPTQATMMKIMPLIFVFMFFKMPAGLVLYWTVNSICTITGQWFLKWQKESKTPSSP